MSPEATGARTAASLLLVAAAVLVACAAAGPSGARASEHPFETLVAESYSGLAEPRREVVRDEAGWARLWTEIHAGVTPAPPRPGVDLARHMLIVVASGSRPSGGFSIKVTRVTTRGERLEVEVLETCPPPGARVSLSLTQPVEVVRLARLSQAPKFLDRRASSCR